MGYSGKLALKNKAQEMRSQGYSYNEILQKIHVSKDTISRWCKDISLTDEQQQRLQGNKTFGQKKGSIIAAENKKNQRIKNINKIRGLAATDISKLTSKENFLIGIALYAAEGTKADKHGAFSNADPSLISFMTKWFLNHAHVPKDKLRGRIWIHNNLDEEVAKKFWSDLTGIPENQFIKSYIVNRKAGSVRKNIHNYGVFTVSFSDAKIHRKIMGWISGLFDDKMSIHSAIAQR